MISENINIPFADYDNNDSLLKEVVEELSVSTVHKTLHHGEKLIEATNKKANKFRDVPLLDLHTSRKNGFASLREIKRSGELPKIPFIIFSNDSYVETVKNVFSISVHHYICKLADFSQRKKVIYEALTLIMQKNNPLPFQEKFMITGDSIPIPNKK